MPSPVLLRPPGSERLYTCARVHVSPINRSLRSRAKEKTGFIGAALAVGCFTAIACVTLFYTSKTQRLPLGVVSSSPQTLSGRFPMALARFIPKHKKSKHRVFISKVNSPARQNNFAKKTGKSSSTELHLQQPLHSELKLAFEKLQMIDWEISKRQTNEYSPTLRNRDNSGWVRPLLASMTNKCGKDHIGKRMVREVHKDIDALTYAFNAQNFREMRQFHDKVVQGLISFADRFNKPSDYLYLEY
mmetsp:Transcript_25088/g.60344  ORF Transcript_25088/g.60344 Transcript_25088/m.60344 type:complete len:245 (-) Transcript_25088:78-812(-)